MLSFNIPFLALAASSIISTTHAHTWVERLRNVAADGSYTGEIGFPRNFHDRTEPGWKDTLQTYQIEAAGPNPSICPPNARDTSDASQRGKPRLVAAPGSAIAMQYLENGHVTLFETQKGKPPNRGTWYIYATQDPKPDDKFSGVFGQWNAEGTGGDKRGRLISTQNFDDGQCFEANPSPLSTKRQQEFAKVGATNTTTYAGANVWCQINLVVPSSVDASKPLSLYAVWWWPTLPGIDPALPKGKNETYTSCMDIDLKASTGSKSVANFNFNNNVNLRDAAVAGTFNKLAQGNIFVTNDTPTGPSGDGTSAAPSSVKAAPTKSSSNLPPPPASTTSQLTLTSAPVKAVMTETVYVFEESTGTLSPTASGLSFSTAGSPTRSVSAAPTSATIPAKSSASTIGSPMLLSQLSGGQLQAPAPTASVVTAGANPVVQAIPPSGNFPLGTASSSATSVPSAPTSSLTTFTPGASATAPVSSGSAASGSLAKATGTAVSSAQTPSTTGSLIARGCKPAGVKRASKIFVPIKPIDNNNNNPLPRRSVEEQRQVLRVHARQFGV